MQNHDRAMREAKLSEQQPSLASVTRVSPRVDLNNLPLKVRELPKPMARPPPLIGVSPAPLPPGASPAPGMQQHFMSPNGGDIELTEFQNITPGGSDVGSLSGSATKLPTFSQFKPMPTPPKPPTMGQFVTPGTHSRPSASPPSSGGSSGSAGHPSSGSRRHAPRPPLEPKRSPNMETFNISTPPGSDEEGTGQNVKGKNSFGISEPGSEEASAVDRNSRCV